MTDQIACATIAIAPADETPRTMFRIPQCNLPRFEAAVAKLSRKAVRFGSSPIVPAYLGETVEKLHDGRKHRVMSVYLDAEPPRVDGWSFVATIDHSKEAGNIVRCVPNTPALPVSYRTVEPHCEHCGTRRYRRDTYVLRSDSGETKQVGKSCLRDFLGNDPMLLAHKAEWLSLAAEAAHDYEDLPAIGGFGAYGRFYTTEFASFAALAVRLHGWVSAKVSEESDGRIESTRTTAMNFFDPAPKDKPLVPKRTEEDHALATAALAWAEGLSETGRDMSDYEHSINVIAKSDFVDRRALGLLASIVGVYKKNLEREAARIAERETLAVLPPSQHVGVEKEILRDLSVTVVGLVTLPDRGFGISTMVRMVDEKGTLFVTIPTKTPMLALQDRLVLKGTVKKHKEYQGEKQTWLTRCKFAPAPATEG